jgi:hypothetical protein
MVLNEVSQAQMPSYTLPHTSKASRTYPRTFEKGENKEPPRKPTIRYTKLVLRISLANLYLTF